MKVLVTGASGFVGKALVAEFAERGFDTVAVGGPRSSETAYSIDVNDAVSVETLASETNVDAVVHAAGIAHRFSRTSDDEFWKVNVTGVENIARLAATLGAKHFVLFSSTLVYGRRRSGDAITEAAECDPADVYGRSKLEGEQAARSICEPAGIDLTILRPAPIVGEGSKGNFARLIKAIDGRQFVWVGKGKNRKSVVYVGDVANAAGEVLAKGGNGTQIFNLAADAVTMKEIVNSIAHSLGRRILPIRLPVFPVRIAARIASSRLSATLDTWLGSDVYCNEKLLEAYGTKPATSLETAIGREVEYYLKHK